MDNLDDYQRQMQGAALEFLKRHQGEHLHEQQLFERCCDYLVRSLEVPAFMAPRLAQLAISQLDGRLWIGWDHGKGDDRTATAVVAPNR